MTILGDVARELFGMFMADARLTMAILALVAAVAGLTAVLGVDPLVGGGVLLVGCHLILIESARRAAHQKKAP